jgi:hypothetical protein
MVQILQSLDYDMGSIDRKHAPILAEIRDAG